MTVLKNFFHSFNQVLTQSADQAAVDPRHREQLQMNEYVNQMEQQDHVKKGLWMNLFLTLKKEFFSFFVLSLLVATAMAVLPLFLNEVFTSLENQVLGERLLQAALSLTVLLVFKLIVDTYCRWKESKLMILIHQVTMRFVFRRIQNIDVTELQRKNKDPISFLTMYASQITQIVYIVDFITTTLLQIVLIVLLVKGFGLLSFVVLGCLILSTFVLQRLIVLIGRVYFQYMTLNHERISLLKTTIEEIKKINRQKIEPQFSLTLKKVRSKQIGVLRKRATLQTINRVLEDNLSPLLSLLLVVLAFQSNLGISISEIFSLLVILGMILSSLSNNLANYRVIRNTKEPTRELEQTIFNDTVKPDFKSENLAKDAKSELLFTNGNEEEAISIQPGDKVAVLGKSGAGKTRLLLKVAGIENSAFKFPLEIANPFRSLLVEKNTILFDASILEIITLFAKEIDAHWYHSAVSKSGLRKDLLKEPGSDLRLLSSVEQNLSEGQLQRVMLAQALYHDPELLLLDNIFSSFDAELAHEVASRLFKDEKKSDTVLFTTSRADLLPYADNFLIIDDEQLILYTKEEVQNQDQYARLSAILGQESMDEWLEELRKAEVENSGFKYDFSKELPTQTLHQPSISSIPIASTYDRTENVAYSLKDFFKNTCSIFTPLYMIWILVSLVVYSASIIVFPYLIQQADGTHPNFLWLGIGVVIAGIVASIIRYLVTYRASIGAIEQLHQSFFDRILSGENKINKNKMIGRVTEDYTDLEMEQPNNLVSIAMALILSLAYLAIFLGNNLIYLVIVIPIGLALWHTYFTVKKVIVASSRLKADVRGPVFNFFSPSLYNRTYRNSDIFKQKVYARFSDLADIHSYGAYWSSLANVRVSFSINGLTMILFIGMIWGTVWFGQYSWIASSVTLYLAYNFSGYLTAIINQLLKMDSTQILFQRLAELNGTSTLPATQKVAKSDPDYTIDRKQLNEENLASLHLVAKNLSYRMEGEEAFLFENLSFELKNGDMMAVVGPSGSGKSTLGNLIAGRLEATEGKLIAKGESSTSDNFDHVLTVESNLPKLAITVREFVDPCSKHTEEAIRLLATELHLHKNDLLSMPLNDLSAGELQIVNLMRAFLISPKWLVLDEATSSVEASVERAMIKKWQQERPETSVVMITHRIRNLDLFEQVISM
ncbi:ATP-binding cassette domain-containing protein [Saccharibacillus sp. JS10]|uniref:ATP-binding cassette domain-containing protein n=1 Tax=Saccharibacillus sp. JS10 TaxID=2950552 RepID=UPI00210C60DA|nr:ATP-binding cassette domain-containing protein [Saccharibacillus sp. JS10]MCQ4086760.1 ATP-binding cassette domain-containing protein [Saccharibacillus sp. JS10]